MSRDTMVSQEVDEELNTHYDEDIQAESDAIVILLDKLVLTVWTTEDLLNGISIRRQAQEQAQAKENTIKSIRAKFEASLKDATFEELVRVDKLLESSGNEIFKKADKEASGEAVTKKTNGPAVAVVQLTLDGKYIAEYTSCELAAYALNTHASRIRRCCNGGETAGGYKWVYKNKYKSYVKSPAGIGAYNSIPVVQLTLDGRYIAKHDSLSEAARNVEGHVTSISKCCRGITTTAHEYKWIFENEWGGKGVKKVYNEVAVVQLSGLTKELVAEHKSLKDAALVIGVNASHICYCCKNWNATAKGFKWMYKSDYVLK